MGRDGPICFFKIFWHLDVFKISRWSYTLQILICKSRIYRGGQANINMWD